MLNKDSFIKFMHIAASLRETRSLYKSIHSKLFENQNNPQISYQRWAWTGSGLDILQDTCDFFGSGLDLCIHFF